MALGPNLDDDDATAAICTGYPRCLASFTSLWGRKLDMLR